MRCHTATSGEDTLSNAHTAEVFGRSLKANHDDFTLALSPSLSIVGKEYDLTGSSTRRCGKTLSYCLGRLEGSLVEYRVEKLVELLWLHACESSLLVDNAGAEKIHCNLNHCSTSALTVTSLE